MEGEFIQDYFICVLNNKYSEYHLSNDSGKARCSKHRALLLYDF